MSSAKLNIFAASMPAFFPAFNATVATGTPFGICNIDRTESHPSMELLDFTGTPITGSGVIEATIPGKCALRRPDIIFKPLLRLLLSNLRSGLLCADLRKLIDAKNCRIPQHGY